MIQEGVLYFCICIESRIAAIAAAEIDLDSKNAEMTDFATLPKWRGMGFAGMLLSHMEKKHGLCRHAAESYGKEGSRAWD